MATNLIPIWSTPRLESILPKRPVRRSSAIEIVNNVESFIRLCYGSRGQALKLIRSTANSAGDGTPRCEAIPHHPDN
jgi:hypothetical protein